MPDAGTESLSYVYDRKVSLVTIASAIDQNIALLDVDETVLADCLAVIHGSFINVIPILNPKRRARYLSITSGEKRDSECITQIKWVRINNDTFFVVLSSLGVQIYDVQVNEVIFYHCCREGGDRINYAVGVCVVDNLLCIGTNLGAVWIFRPNENNNNFAVVGKHYAHDDPIEMLDGCDKFLISCSERNTYIWRVHHGDVEIIRQIEIPGLHAPPTALKVSTSQIFIGYDSGEFCIFDIIDEKTCVRSVGHLLKVVDIDFSPLVYMILTASLDGYLKIWAFDQRALKVTCKFVLYNELGPLCAARFLNLTCTSFCLVTIGEIDVKFYKSTNAKEDNGYKESVKFDNSCNENLLQND